MVGMGVMKEASQGKARHGRMESLSAASWGWFPQSAAGGCAGFSAESPTYCPHGGGSSSSSSISNNAVDYNNTQKKREKTEKTRHGTIVVAVQTCLITIINGFFYPLLRFAIPRFGSHGELSVSVSSFLSPRTRRLVPSRGGRGW